MRVLGIVGQSGSGKTTLIEALIPRLVAAGLSVSTIKHTHHGVDLDRPGKDSWRHRQAGAREVLLAGAERWALLHEVPPDAAPPALPSLLARLAPVDLVLVEGFRRQTIDQLEVYRAPLGKPPLWPRQPEIRAIAADPLPLGPDWPAPDRPVLPLAEPARISAWVLGWMATAAQPA